MTPDWVDKPIKTLVGGWGDRLFMGVLLDHLRRAKMTPERLWQYICDDTSLLSSLPSISDKQWAMFRRMANPAKVGDVTIEIIISELADQWPDLNDVILNHPKGKAWLRRQLDEIKTKLTS